MPRTSSGKMIHFKSPVAKDERHPEDQPGDDRDFVGLEDVRGHSRAVPHVVSHEVRDDRGVARIVLRHTGLDLADQVRAHVGGFRVDPAAHAHEQGEQRAAEAEPQEGVRGGHSM